jgi:hypothetical protein
MFTSEFLSDLRHRALRRGVWYRALDRVERGIMSLTSRFVDRVESVKLGKALVKIVAKIRDGLKSGFVRHMESYGISRAAEMASQALEWGYSGASDWWRDQAFVKYLTFLDYNKSTGWGLPP